MLVTITISNKSYWVATWKMMSSYAKRSACSTTKMAKTNPDGTVCADIDYELISELADEIAQMNDRFERHNTLSMNVSVGDYQKPTHKEQRTSA